MRKRTKAEKKSKMLKNKSDKELISLAHTLQDAVTSVDCFNYFDLMLREAVLAELEERKFVIRECLVIKHESEITSEQVYLLGRGKEGESGEDVKGDSQGENDP